MGQSNNTVMKQEVIHDFLNVPGIVGVALMDGSARPYFHGFKENFNFSHQNAVAQSIQQVLETTPEGFTSFEFQFDLYRVYLHKLNRGITLLVLTRNQLPRPTYIQAVRRLLIELQIDQDDPIEVFRSLASQLASTLSSTAPAAPPAEPKLEAQPPEISKPEPQPEPQTVSQPELAPLSPIASNSEPSQGESGPPPPAPEAPVVFSVSAPSSAAQSVSVKDILAAMNALSQYTTQYLGTLVVANYWKSTRPPVDWLNHFQIERSGQMTFVVQAPSERLPTLTPEQLQCLRTWVSAFIARCSKVIRDFAKIVQHFLDERQKALLFGPDR